MGVGSPRALLVGEKPGRRSNLAEHIQSKGCEYTFAASYDEARSHLFTTTFDLVFSPMRLSGMNLFPLMDLLEGSESTLFYIYPVEQGFWCLPAVRQGQRCFGSSGLRPSEFLSHLDALIEGIRTNRCPASRPDPKYSNGTAVAVSASHPELLPPGSVHHSTALQKRKATA